MASANQRGTSSPSTTPSEVQTTHSIDQESDTADGASLTPFDNMLFTVQGNDPDLSKADAQSATQAKTSIDQEPATGFTPSVHAPISDRQKLNISYKSAPTVHRYINKTARKLSYQGTDTAFAHYRRTQRLPSSISERKINRVNKTFLRKYRSSYAKSIKPEFWKRWENAIEAGQDVEVALGALSDNAKIDNEGIKILYPDRHSVILGGKPSNCEEGSAMDELCQIVTVDCDTGVDDDFVKNVLG